MDKQQNVVFFIGAGFSAPFGLPIMSNFIDKAKDLYFSDMEKYKEIGKTLSLIENYSLVKNYMNLNLHNIEDLLSISYMESLLKENTKLLKSIKEFIKIVIISYSNNDLLATKNFVKYIANVSLEKENNAITIGNKETYYKWKPIGKIFKDSNFSIISLNYDLIIENTLSIIAEEYGSFYIKQNEENRVGDLFATTKDCSHAGIPMAKLHGSIDGFIVPPTWNKNVNNNILADWKLATKLLSEATHVIFLGYSLPSSDNYIKYLLASSLNGNRRLKKISIVTIDSDRKTEQRYRSLFELNVVFHNTDIRPFFSLFVQNSENIDFDEFDSLLSSRTIMG